MRLVSPPLQPNSMSMASKLYKQVVCVLYISSVKVVYVLEIDVAICRFQVVLL
jgi:hypothetical protein